MEVFIMAILRRWTREKGSLLVLMFTIVCEHLPRSVAHYADVKVILGFLYIYIFKDFEYSFPDQKTSFEIVDDIS